MSCNLDARSSNSYSLTGPNVHSTSIYLGKYCSCLTLITQSYVLLFLHTQVTKFLILRPKFKKLFVSRTRLTVRRRCNSKYFFAWFATNFFFFFWFPILFQNLRSELVYTFKWTKSIARLWRNQICEWKKKKIQLPTDP
jgi:hypothetical protein